MTNTTLFSTKRGEPAVSPPTDTVNEAGGAAYALRPKTRLAQYVATGAFQNTFHVKADAQLAALIPLLDEILVEPGGPLFIAKCAWWGRHRAFTKEAPAFIVAYLGCRGDSYFELAFDTVIDNGRMLRNFAQMVRSGTLGRQSFGSRMKRAIKRWFDARDSRTLLNASIGNNPSLADVIRMAHPLPKTVSFPVESGTRARVETRQEREALYGYLLGHPKVGAAFPPIIQELETFRTRVRSGGIITSTPDVHFDFLTSMPLDPRQWKEIAMRAGHQWLRMNLKTMARHGVFDDFRLAEMVAHRLSDAREVVRARQLPYQYLTTFKAVETDPAIPPQIKSALQTAMDFSCENIPQFPEGTIVGVDVSPSMSSAVTGDRGSASSETSCKTVAAMFAAAILKKCPTAHVMPFANGCMGVLHLNPRDSLATLAGRIEELSGSGTCISSVLERANNLSLKSPLVIYLSDNQSWLETYRQKGLHGPLFDFNPQPSATMLAWESFTRRNPGARLVMVDLAPGDSSQAPDRSDMLNIGGWSDRIFTPISGFVSGAKDQWVDLINGVNFHVDRSDDQA